MESELRHIDRWEWWLWFSALVVTALAGIVFLLSSFHSLFLHNEHFFEIRSDQARWGILSLLLLFNVWLIHRQRVFRRLRRRVTELSGDAPASVEVNDPSRMDPVTGLYTRASAEQSLGREVARARRKNLPLSLVALHLDDFAELNKRVGRDAAELVLKEFASRLRKASRGSDFCVRLGDDDFVVILPECSLGDAKIVSDRLGTLEMKCAGEDVTLGWSVGWIDYKRGEIPADLFKRAKDVLQLYRAASKDSSAATLVIR
ncbi:MAG TPA: GGDEF domain-containing protein [Candidatus Acidoferrales bacterium]|nr:GGDEF domain-containing protein [Candidatus Acidoferrales bacterium]